MVKSLIRIRGYQRHPRRKKSSSLSFEKTAVARSNSAFAKATVQGYEVLQAGWPFVGDGRGPDWGVSLRRKAPGRIALHEIKSTAIYRLEQRTEKASARGLLLWAQQVFLRTWFRLLT